MMRFSIIASPLILALAAFASLPARASGVGDLPLVEVPATRHDSPRFMLFLSGDGGWAGLDKAVAARSAQAGISVIGPNSRRYFWTESSPDTATRMSRGASPLPDGLEQD
jgi:type IV secretory pathway VirJ component